MVDSTTMEGIIEIWRAIWGLTCDDCYHDVRHKIDQNIVDHIKIGDIVMNIQYIMEGELKW